MSAGAAPPISKHDRIDSAGKPAQCLILRNRSSSIAAMSLPSCIRTAETSPWYAFSPKISIFNMNSLWTGPDQMVRDINETLAAELGYPGYGLDVRLSSLLGAIAPVISRPRTDHLESMTTNSQ